MAEEKGIHAGHRSRMKTRFLETEGAGMEDYELLEMLLYYSVVQRDTNPLAHKLMEQFGSLAGVLQAAPEALTEMKGVTESTAVLLKLVLQLMSRYEKSLNDPKMIMDTTEKLQEYLRPYFLGQRREQIYMLSIDAKGRLLGCDFLGEGNDCAVTLDVRRLTAAALRHRASWVVLAHSHPSGIAMPSQDDITTTRHCQQALAPLGIFLQDHLIFADDECVSMRESGLLR